MKLTFAFDIYGTIIDTDGIYQDLKDMLFESAKPFTDLWRTKQLEYSWRRGLMENYVDFSRCTSDALDYCSLYFGIDINANDKRNLLNAYRTLPAFPDVEGCLKALKDQGHKLYAFSNGSKYAVSELLKNTQLLHHFSGIVSSEDVKMFKPSPLIYSHFIRVTESPKSGSWLISANVFDVAGAAEFGMQTAWVRRDFTAPYDPGMKKPKLIIDDLSILSKAIDRWISEL